MQLHRTIVSPVSKAATAAVIMAGLAACGPSAEDREAARAAVAAAEAAAVRAVDARVDSAAAILAEQPGLIASTRSELRRNLNTEQVATATKLGVSPVRDSAELRALVEQGALVALEDSTGYWVVRELDHSVPYVTPDTRAMLMDLGRTFHARLDSLGLPPFRFEVSSVLRTAAMQAGLRTGNANASRTTSSHEFGTTVDIAYNAFAPPSDPSTPAHIQLPDTAGTDAEQRGRIEAAAHAAARAHTRLRLAELGEERAAELKGILGQILAEMQDIGKVQPLHERAQPVFHMTVATRYPDPSDPGTVRAE